jgi:hypothetical protein
MRILKILKLAPLVTLVLSCTSPGVLTPRPGSPNGKIVQVLWPSVDTPPLTAEAWQRSPWYRMESDMVTPSRVVISMDNYACVMRDGDVSSPMKGYTFICQDQWRMPRHR